MIVVAVQRRLKDLDAHGHVNSVVFHNYLQEARVGLIGTVEKVANADYSQIVVNQQVTQIRPVHYSDAPLAVQVWTEHLARTSYTLGYRILDESGTTVAEATSRLAVIDTGSGRPIRIPEELHRDLAAHLH